MSLEALHAPYAALLRARLAALSPRGAGLALDLGCGPGLKLGWLAEQLGPGGMLVGIDIDQGALRAAAPDRFAPPGHLSYPSTPAVVRKGLEDMNPRPSARWSPILIAGDAHAIPLRDASCDLCWCVATLGLLRDPALALAEARRVLRPGGSLVVSVAGERWVRARAWPPGLPAALGYNDRAAEHGLGRGGALPPADGLGDELRDLLASAGLTVAALRADLLDLVDPAWPSDLPLLAWHDLRPLAAHRLDDAGAAACVAAEEQAEPEVRPVLLVARAHARVST